MPRGVYERSKPFAGVNPSLEKPKGEFVPELDVPDHVEDPKVWVVMESCTACLPGSGGPIRFTRGDRIDQAVLHAELMRGGVKMKAVA